MPKVFDIEVSKESLYLDCDIRLDIEYNDRGDGVGNFPACLSKEQAIKLRDDLASKIIEIEE